MPISKRFGNKVMSLALSILLCISISDGQTGFHGISRDLGLAFRLRGEYTYTQEMIIQAKLNNFRIIEVPIHFYQRRSGKSRLIRNPFIYLFKIVIICAKTYLDYKIKRHA